MNQNYPFEFLRSNLERKGIFCTDEVIKDFQKLVSTEINTFIETIFRDFSRMKFYDYNRFEILHLNSLQKKKIKGNNLWRYEYRNTSNLRCIFIICNDNNKDIPILLCAFIEDGSKKNGNKTYNKNIDKAIDIFLKYVED